MQGVGVISKWELQKKWSLCTIPCAGSAARVIPAYSPSCASARYFLRSFGWALVTNWTRNEPAATLAARLFTMAQRELDMRTSVNQTTDYQEFRKLIYVLLKTVSWNKLLTWDIQVIIKSSSSYQQLIINKSSTHWQVIIESSLSNRQVINEL